MGGQRGEPFHRNVEIWILNRNPINFHAVNAYHTSKFNDFNSTPDNQTVAVLVGALHGHHFASFSTNGQSRCGLPKLIDLVEDQCVDCLDADNPDCWVVRVRSILIQSLRLQRQLKREPELADLPLSTEVSDDTLLYESLTNNEVETPKTVIGRVNSCSLSRNLKGVLKRKRDPRELFREEVISISNKQQEAKMKRRYALTELVETEREYIRALKPLAEVLSRVGGQLTLQVGTDSERIIDLPVEVRQTISGLQQTLKRITEFSENKLLGDLIASTWNAQFATECFVKQPEAMEQYTVYLIHLDALVKHVAKLNGAESEVLFSITDLIPDLSTTGDGSETTAAPWLKRSNISFRYLLELADLPRLRLTAYRGLLRDVARYTARSGADTEQLEMAMTCFARAIRRAEESTNLWALLHTSSSTEQTEWHLRYRNEYTGSLLPPALIRLTDLQTNVRNTLEPDESNTQSGRLVLLPNHLVFLSASSQPDGSQLWNMAWEFKLEDLRLGASESTTHQSPWFEVWNVSVAEPIKSVIRIYCPNRLNLDAWIEDVCCTLMALINCPCQDTQVPRAIVDAHEEAILQNRLKFAYQMDLPGYQSESLEDVFVDAPEYQRSIEFIRSTTLNEADLAVAPTMLSKDSTRLDDSASSSYHTAEEAAEDETLSRKKDTSVTLYGKESIMPEEPPVGAVTKTLTVHAGEQIQFNAAFTISGPVAYEVKWLMNGLPIPSTIGADMILSDTDTRLLIADADPIVHSGTYTCKCRLFEGTETAVYFHVNVLPDRLEQIENREEEQQNEATTEVEEKQLLKSVECTKSLEYVDLKLLEPLMEQLDVPIGQVLELQVKINEKILDQLTHSLRKEDHPLPLNDVMVQWYNDGVLLQSTPNCKLLQQNGIFNLQTTTSSFLPDTQSEYTCTVQLPVGEQQFETYSATMTVKFHEPTTEELEMGFHPVTYLTPSAATTSLPKAVSISDLVDIQLIQGQRFILVAPYDLRCANENTTIWWTLNNQLIAGRNLDIDDPTEFKCLLNKINQTIKLVKPVVQRADVGLYTCWVSDVGYNQKGKKCIEYAVDVLESESEQDTENGSESSFVQHDFEMEELDEDVFGDKGADDLVNYGTLRAKQLDKVEEERIVVVESLRDTATTERTNEEDETYENDETENKDAAEFLSHTGLPYEMDLQNNDQINEPMDAKVELLTSKLDAEDMAIDTKERCSEEARLVAEETSEEQRRPEEKRLTNETAVERKTTAQAGKRQEDKQPSPEKEGGITVEIGAHRERDEIQRLPAETKAEFVAEETERERVEEERLAAEAEAKRKAEEAERKRVEEERLAAEAEAKRKAEEAERKRVEEERLAAEAEAKRKAEEAERKRVEEERLVAEAKGKSVHKEAVDSEIQSQFRNEISTVENNEEIADKNEVKLKLTEADNNVSKIKRCDDSTEDSTVWKHEADDGERNCEKFGIKHEKHSEKRKLHEKDAKKSDKTGTTKSEIERELKGEEEGKVTKFENEKDTTHKVKSKRNEVEKETSVVMECEAEQQKVEKLEKRLKKKESKQKKVMGERKLSTDDVKRNKVEPVEVIDETEVMPQEMAILEKFREEDHIGKQSETKHQENEKKEKDLKKWEPKQKKDVKKRKQSEEDITQKADDKQHVDERERNKPDAGEMEPTEGYREEMGISTLQGKLSLEEVLETNQSRIEDDAKRHKDEERRIKKEERKRKRKGKEVEPNYEKGSEHGTDYKTDMQNETSTTELVNYSDNQANCYSVSTSGNLQDDILMAQDITFSYFETLRGKRDKSPLQLVLNHDTPILKQARESVFKTDDSLSFSLAEAIALSGECTVYVEQGQSFDINITDLPNISLRTVWSYNDELLAEDLFSVRRMNKAGTLKESTPVATVHINDMDTEHAGLYRLQIFDEDDNVQDSSPALLATIDLPVQLKKYDLWNEDEKEMKSQHAVHEKVTSIFQPVHPTTVAQIDSIHEGSNIDLTAEFPNFCLDFKPNDFEWLLNGKPLNMDSERISSHCVCGPDHGLISLSLQEVRPDQTGTYSLGFTEDAAEAIAQSAAINTLTSLPPRDVLLKKLVFPKLTIKPKPEHDGLVGSGPQYEPTRAAYAFERDLPPTVSIKEGERVNLEATVAKKSKILMHEWLFNGKPIIPEFTSDYTVWRTNNSLMLTIPRARPELNGTYELRVYEDTGVYCTQTQLDVEQTRLRSSSYKLTPADGLKPIFTKRLHDHTMDVGDCLRLTVRVMAEPPAVIVWKHNGAIVTGDHRVKLFNDDANASLTIRQVKSGDRGRYSCIATNALGRVTTESILQVNGVEQFAALGDEEDDSEDQAPRIADGTERNRSAYTALPRTAPELRLDSVDTMNVALSWKPLMQPDITYIVELSRDGGKWWRPILNGVSDTFVNISSDVASPLDSLLFRVLAENKFGIGPASQSIRIPARACIPTMPAIKPEVEFEEAAAVLIRWPKATTGSSTEPYMVMDDYTINPATRFGHVWYAVEVREGAQSEWRRVAADLTGLSYLYHLRPGVSSAIRVVAINQFGESNPTPIALVHLDPSTLAPAMDFDPPWVAVTHQAYDGCPKPGQQKTGITVYWKPAHMPEYCTACVSGLEPMYRIEWRRGRTGMWQALADDVTDPEAGFRLPNNLVMAVLDDVKQTSDSKNTIAINNQTVELRVFCWNKFGESGPTKPCRLVASQLFRGQTYKNSIKNMDKHQDSILRMEDCFNEWDQFPVVTTDDRYLRLRTYINSISPVDGIELSWEKFTQTCLPNGAEEIPIETHGRYRIEQRLPVDRSTEERIGRSRYRWKVCNMDTALIYGENCVLDVRPGKEEQVYRLLALSETDNCSVWVDAYNTIRIPPLTELCPSAPMELTIRTVPVTGCTVSAENHLSWRSSTLHPVFSQGYDKQDTMSPIVRYRVEARSVQSDLASWRQVCETFADDTYAVDKKAEAGLQLIYRITPVNEFGEGPALISSPVRTPPLYSSLEGCVEDLRYTILGPSSLQLRWRLGDSAIDILEFGGSASNHTGPKRSGSSSLDLADRVNFTVEVRSGYAGDWSPLVEQIPGDLAAKVKLDDMHYMQNDLSCRVVAFIDGQRSAPSRPVQLNIKADSLAPDFSLVKPHVVISSVDEYLFRWDEPHVQETYSAHILALTTPQVLQKDTRYAVQIQREGNSTWETLVENLEEPHWSWFQPNPLWSYHFRVLPSNQFGSGVPSRAVRIEPQVVIPDLSFMRPTIESPVDILAATTAPELVWQLPRAYSLDKTLTPFTYEVQVRGVGHSRSALAPVPDRGRSTSNSRGTTTEEEETRWRVLETNVKRTRLSLGRLDPEKEFWLRVVAVTDYGRGAPSQPVRKLVDLAAISPTFIEPKGQVIYAPIGGHLELKCCLQPMRYDPEIRFSWFLNEKPININESHYPHRMSRHHSYVSKNSDYAVLQVDHLTDVDFGIYVCKAVNIRGTAAKEFVVKKAELTVMVQRISGTLLKTNGLQVIFALGGNRLIDEYS
ncbi:hypothetical protein P879_00680 [Paragonimus westermani]|uniref:Obscurin n=1 Tax=Paragonimus westermani TaxID=34504 RepID=A0A8T0DSB9_9TREM|nr:hypothetical protein P879_00680 [Paragonimus westermani]